MKNFTAYVAWTKKAIVNVLGLLTALLTLGLLPDPYNAWVATAVAVLTAILHFIVENAPAPGTEVASETETDEYSEDQPAEWQPANLVTASQVAAAQKQIAPPSPDAEAPAPPTIP